MASAGSRVMWAGLAALLALLAVAGASTLTLFDGPGCAGSVGVVSCGSCHDIELHGGYYFLYTEGSAYFYSSAGCAGTTPAEVLTGNDVWYCNTFAYNSVYVTCSSSLSSWDITTTAQQQ